MTSLQDFHCGILWSCSTVTQSIVEASHRQRFSFLERVKQNRRRQCPSTCVAGISGKRGVVASIAKLEKQSNNNNNKNNSNNSNGLFKISGADLTVSLLAAALITSCPPASSADFESLNSANAKCSLTGVQANGYEYAYPKSWIRDRIRGIEVLVHDPEVAGLNMSIFTGPAQSGTLSGSAAEVGEAIITQYQKSPTIDKAELLGVDMKQDGSINRSYSIELFVEAGGKQRHFLTKLIRTDRKVLSLTIQVPEDLWQSNASCMNSVVQNFKQTVIL